jgi:hypothetical protein
MRLSWAVSWVEVPATQHSSDGLDATMFGDSTSRLSFRTGVCPDKADMFSGNQSRQGKSQKPCSTGRICGGNEADEADRQSHLRDGERVTGPQRK